MKSFAEWRKQIETFAALRDGWDSYGGMAISSETVRLALMICAHLPDDWLVVPCADGSIQFSDADDNATINVYGGGDRP